VEERMPVLLYLSSEAECQTFAKKINELKPFIFIIRSDDNMKNLAVIEQIEKDLPEKPMVILTTKAASVGINFH
jgi:hypothetical protein